MPGVRRVGILHHSHVCRWPTRSINQCHFTARAWPSAFIRKRMPILRRTQIPRARQMLQMQLKARKPPCKKIFVWFVVTLYYWTKETAPKQPNNPITAAKLPYWSWHPFASRLSLRKNLWIKNLQHYDSTHSINQRDGSFGMPLAYTNQKNRPFGLWFMWFAWNQT